MGNTPLPDCHPPLPEAPNSVADGWWKTCLRRITTDNPHPMAHCAAPYNDDKAEMLWLYSRLPTYSSFYHLFSRDLKELCAEAVLLFLFKSFDLRSEKNPDFCPKKIPIFVRFSKPLSRRRGKGWNFEKGKNNAWSTRHYRSVSLVVVWV